MLSAIANDTHSLLYAMAVKLAGEHIKRGSKTWCSQESDLDGPNGTYRPRLAMILKGVGHYHMLLYALAQWYTSNADVTIDEMMRLGAITTNMKT